MRLVLETIWDFSVGSKMGFQCRKQNEISIGNNMGFQCRKQNEISVGNNMRLVLETIWD